MMERAESSAATSGDPVGVLTREFWARLLNFSPSGCLVETNMRVEVGTIGSLQFVFDGNEFVDDVQVVRCQQIEGAGSLYQVGARFLWTAAAGRGTLRSALEQSSQSVAGIGFRLTL
jgi:hypothetical protein